jgi:retron-type reverse transcriptase
VLERDIEACFDEISHPALMDRIRERIGDKRVLALIKAFLCAGVLSEDGVTRDTKMGTPQGGILSPLLANIALSVLDDHFAEAWQRDMATRQSTTVSHCSTAEQCRSRVTATAERRSRHRGTRPPPPPDQRHGPVESRMRWKPHVRFRGRAGETHQPKR